VGPVLQLLTSEVVGKEEGWGSRVGAVLVMQVLALPLAHRFRVSLCGLVVLADLGDVFARMQLKINCVNVTV
jgi:hypothetical protein